MGARDQILKKLRKAQKPFEEVNPIENRRSMVPMSPDLTQDELVQRFTEEAEKLSCYVYQLNANDAFEQVMDLVGDDKSLLSWDAEHIPLDRLHDNLKSVGVTVAEHDDGNVRVGITGATSAFAATGSMVLASGAGRYRTTSLLPDRHIALIKPEQILPDFETWQQLQQQDSYPAFTQSSNTTIVTGPSKTADIAQELIKGAHGPREVHIIILSED